MMLEHAYYSVISPEGCASILWRDATQAPQAAEALRLTASDCLELGVVDRVIPEPLGGAHRNLPAMVEVLRGEVLASFEGLGKIPPDVLVMQRSEKFGRMGCYAAAPS
jgi:acetyl-CoA carboxylase carboxyl transferase subunit alpha